MLEGFISMSVSQYSYAALVPASLIAQPLVALIAGVLVRLGSLYFPLAYTCVVGGALLGDIMWYSIGRRWGDSFAKRYGRYFNITEHQISATKRIFSRNQGRILFLSKITNGFGFAIVILFTAGLSRISFARFILYNIAGEMIWTGALMGVSIFLSGLYAKVGSIIDGISLTAFVILAFLGFYGVARYVRSRLIGDLENV